MCSIPLQLFIGVLFVGLVSTLRSSLSPALIDTFLNRATNYSLSTTVPIQNDIVIHFKKQSYVKILAPLELFAATREGLLQLFGERPINGLQLDVENCVDGTQNNADCNAVVAGLFLSVTVLRSPIIASLVVLVGWAYFTAWSVSFYPQIFLNIRRQSVVGLNFDFLVLNIIGFAAYSAYNLFMYIDGNVQKQYEEAHPHSPIPVLLNDVFFAVHALIVCIFTAAQCFFYQVVWFSQVPYSNTRGNQRVSFTCLAISAAMILGAAGAAAITFLGFINMLHFVTSLSYIKMIVTLLKYIPQAVQNIRRQSTTGWSIGNVLLDFTGGCLDILQMCLQCWNVADWSAFYGNPVKFALGFISISFDIFFMVQHYVWYRNEEEHKSTSGSNKLTMSMRETDDLGCEQESSAKANSSTS